MNSKIPLNSQNEICTWKNDNVCVDCSLDSVLICKFKLKYLLSFIILFLLFAIPAILGVILAGYAWFLLGWFIFWVIFFEFWEIRILCSHCPFYAKKGRFIRCIGNYGCLKVWKYHPEPINRNEKIQLLIGFLIFFGYPFIFMILGRRYIFLILTSIGLTIFLGVLIKRRCAKCINFSCFFNRVPKEIVNEFLSRNPTMKKAWKKINY
ncbi:MAG: hypothetical protein ACFFAO_11140 [Candidatus Hermodarchaeota archaeon]